MKTFKKVEGAEDWYPPIITLKDSSDWYVVPNFSPYREETDALIYFMDKFEPPNTSMLNREGYIVEGNMMSSGTYQGLFYYHAKAKK